MSCPAIREWSKPSLHVGAIASFLIPSRYPFCIQSESQNIRHSQSNCRLHQSENSQLSTCQGGHLPEASYVIASRPRKTSRHECALYRYIPNLPCNGTLKETHFSFHVYISRPCTPLMIQYPCQPSIKKEEAKTSEPLITLNCPGQLMGEKIVRKCQLFHIRIP